MSFEESLIRVVEETVRRVVREELQAKGPEVMTLEQASAYSGLAAKTLRNWKAEGRLKATKKRGRVYVHRADLDRARAGTSPEEEATLARLRRTA